ncbi:HupE/UreJ family protein [Pyxidicoccus parkwayensis]|uniref:HupE/UreJ family protein n=1 Tax=Pyxidicoccus parkwayensis TaxID=2813578 RepID=A0ABX7P8U6_9BACT|nr:HupE/UreJ family protein [Pyxidicoccus parkwaysis]QSQ26876.1 HupE/UreJ family protein [Pyxidicoccus parkwaysis]
MTRASPRVVLAAVLLAAGAASAHDADILYSQVRRTAPNAGGEPRASTGAGPEGSEVRQVLTLTAGTLGLLLPADADGDGTVSQADLDARRAALEVGVWDALPLTAGGRPCTRTSHAALLRQTYVELSATFTCPPGPLRQTYTVLSVLPAGYRVILGSSLDGEVTGSIFADAAQPSVDIPEASAGGEGGATVSGFAGWVLEGIRHIFTGYDHLAFLVAVLLVGGGWRRVLLLVSSFTIAHSITLGAVVLGWVSLDGDRARWVEATIAASIIYVALENLVLREHRHRALVTFLFGLVHGFGFASVLKNYGLGDSVAPALLGFNIGVELGQASVVAVLLPVLRMVRRRPALYLRTVRAVSVLILAAGGYWMFERALG